MTIAELAAPALQAVGPAHGGLREGQSLWLSWQLEPQVLIPVALAALFYYRGLRPWEGRTRRHSPWRVASYYAGLAVLLLAVQSPLDVAAEHHFTFHMLQHELLMMFAVPLILLGAPTTPVLRGMPRWLRIDVVRPLAGERVVRRLYRLVTHPLVAVSALTVTLWAWHLMPGWYDAALRDDLVHGVQHASFAFVAVLFWWNVIDPAPLHARMSYPLRMVFLLVGSTPKHFLAAFITFSGEAWYRAYAEMRPLVDLSLEGDQVVGGLVMWAPSQMMHLVAIAIVFFVWAGKSEREQQARERTQLAAPNTAGDGIPTAN